MTTESAAPAPVDFDAVAYINTPRWQESRLGLERIVDLLERLGRPQDSLRFVHVGGTNGKGSTCAYLASILQAAGYKTGLFTSPYVHTFNERIRVNGENIPDAALTSATLQVKQHADAMEAETGDHPTEFELMTAVAIQHFANSGCDIAVLEVGMGGRLDSTNAIDAPEVSVIARIGLDHTKFLGNTLEAVAGEKAGIVKAGVPVVSWPQDPEAMAVVRRAVAERGCTLAVPDFDQLQVGKVETGESDVGGATASGDPGDAPIGGPVRPFTYRGQAYETRMLATYQPQNAALALEAVEALRSRGWDIPQQEARTGIAQAQWPGRFEVLPRSGGRPACVIDGGHNPQGAHALAESLADVFPGQRPVFVIGVMADKDYPAMLDEVVPLGSGFVAVTPPNPRALPAQKLARAIRWTGQDLLGCSACVAPYVARDYADAVRHACEQAGPDGLVCAFGSLYQVAAVKEALATLSS